MPLPEFIPPMLAVKGEPFDSDDFLFEVKWDGVRALAFRDERGYRVMNRRKVNITNRFPEFEGFDQLPVGTVLDGELVVFDNGKPVFARLQERDHLSDARKIRHGARSLPATFVAFDQLYALGDSVMDLPLSERRLLLEHTVSELGQPWCVLSDGIVGQGAALFAEVRRRDLEGIMAKRLTSPYLPGKRPDTWLKIKKRSAVLCAIIGFVPADEDPDDFRSLILACDDHGTLRFCGKVGTGFNQALRDKMNRLLREHPRAQPLVPCKEPGQWIEPGLFARVSFLEMTAGGELRDPAFEELIEDA